MIELLEKYNLKISTAESCTGGMAAARLTSYSGMSRFFEMGFITYSNESKIKLLGVKKEVLEQFGAVSSQCAAEMCEGLLQKSGADVAISITGIAGPDGGTAEKPVGLVYIGIAGKFGTKVFKNIFSGSRDEVRSQSVDAAFSFAENEIIDFYG